MGTKCNVFKQDLPPKPELVLRGAALGNFDGVHLGHQTSLSRVVDWSGGGGVRESVVISFHPHPLTVLRNISIPKLANLRQTREELQSNGIDSLLLIRFTEKLAALSPEEFVEDILIQRLEIDTLFVGPDAAVGKNRAGTVDVLRALLERNGKSLEVVPFDTYSGKKIGSGRIRDSLAAGDVDQVKDMLGRPFAIEGRVQHGDARGRTLGFPTANLLPGQYQLPAYGVYATMVLLEGKSYQAVTNVGVRPTIGGEKLLIESYLLDYHGLEFYNSRIEVCFYSKLRAEMRFDGLPALKAQIGRDIVDAKKFFASGVAENV